MLRKCSKCALEKSIDLFPKNKNKKLGRAYRCKDCVKKYYQTNRVKLLKQKKENYDSEAKKIYNKRYYKLNLEKLKDYQKKNRIENNKKINAQRKKYRERNRETLRKASKKYAQENKSKRNKKLRQRYKEDLLFKIYASIRSSIKKGLKNNTKRTFEILGCSFSYFKEYIESKFEPWMTWDNHGLYDGTYNKGWDFDHIVPISSAKNQEELLKLNHYTNFQPLCSRINRVEKRDSICQSTVE